MCAQCLSQLVSICVPQPVLQGQKWRAACTSPQSATTAARRSLSAPDSLEPKDPLPLGTTWPQPRHRPHDLLQRDKCKLILWTCAVRLDLPLAATGPLRNFQALNRFRGDVTRRLDRDGMERVSSPGPQPRKLWLVFWPHGLLRCGLSFR